MRAIGGKVGRLVRRKQTPPDPAAETVRRAAKRAKVDKKGAFLLREDERPDAEPSTKRDKPPR